MNYSNSKEDFDNIHDIAPGKHFYQFYKSPDDLLRILIPYWKSGVQKKNFCFWVIPVFMTVEEAKAELREAIPNIQDLINSGHFEIVLHADWYGDGETFDGDLVIERYIKKMKWAVTHGFPLVRVAGDTSGFKPHLWNALQEYERKGQSQVHLLPCVVLCSYSIHSLRLQQTKDVLDHHHGVLVAKV